jgi:hypothetical protein
MKYGYTRVSTDGQSIDASSRRPTDRLQVEEAGREEPSCKQARRLPLFAGDLSVALLCKGRHPNGLVGHRESSCLAWGSTHDLEMRTPSGAVKLWVRSAAVPHLARA